MQPPPSIAKKKMQLGVFIRLICFAKLIVHIVNEVVSPIAL